MEKKRILIVDDEAAEARLLKVNLEQTGCYEARVETWPQGAIAAAHDFKPHLVILDILMSRMPGGNVAAAFKEDRTLKDVPVIFLTGALQKHQIEEHEGIISNHPCLAKPAGLPEILKFIESNLSQKSEPGLFRRHMLPKEADDED